MMMANKQRKKSGDRKTRQASNETRVAAAKKQQLEMVETTVNPAAIHNEGDLTDIETLTDRVPQEDISRKLDNFIMEGIRYNIPDEDLAAIGNSLLKDFGIVNEDVDVLDAAKVRREKIRIGGREGEDRELEAITNHELE